ncbi:MAG: flagellar motor protein MotB [Proteobacteria bacterium]|nr:flagellar motor protein MotB [Pseudomonadota bacterium]MBU1610625.1 flagellar motor protein MotB [Pseudomonadota bacterium]
MARMQENETEFGKNFDLLDDSSGEVRGTTSWAVPWSDLMMVMFVLFVVLYVYASTHQEVRFIFTDRTPPRRRTDFLQGSRRDHRPHD